MNKFFRILIFLVLVSALICLLLMFLLLFYGLSSHQNIVTIHSFKDATEILNSLDKEDIVFFDVDDTLIVPGTKALWSKNIETHKDFLSQLEEKTLYRPENLLKNKPAGYYRSIWKKQDNPILIELLVIDIIRSLQDRGVKVFACTALPAREDFVIPYLPEWRFEKLRVVGIDFSRSYDSNVELTNLQDSNGGYTYHPILYKGILCTGRLNKGVVIGNLLDALSWHPKKIIFFDDSLKRVEDVVTEMKKRNIACIGYHYRGEEDLTGDFDQKVVEFQMHYLVDHEQWLSEEKAGYFLREQMKLSYE